MPETIINAFGIALLTIAPVLAVIFAAYMASGSNQRD